MWLNQMNVLVGLLFLASAKPTAAGLPRGKTLSPAVHHSYRPRTSALKIPEVDISRIRGGAKKSVGNEKMQGDNKIVETLNRVQPSTRLYLLLVAACTAVHLTGLPAPDWFSLDIRGGRWLQLWRPFTSMAYFGTPSMSMASNIYFLLNYGQLLERETGSSTHAWFLLVQTTILTIFGFALQFPFQSQAFITAIIYVSSRRNSFETIPFQFGMTIYSWQLTFFMMGLDCLSKQNLSAAWPHMLGILSGHIYIFFTEVWPSIREGGVAYLKPPELFLNTVGRISYLNPDDSAKESSSRGRYMKGTNSRKEEENRSGFFASLSKSLLGQGRRSTGGGATVMEQKSTRRSISSRRLGVAE